MAERDAVRDAWQIHTALTDLIGKADGKASFALAIESAALTAILAMSGPHEPFGRLEGLWVALLRAGVVLICVGGLTAVVAVLPRLWAGPADRQWPRNHIYFGHLRQWDPRLLAQRLSEEDPLPALARQIVIMSRIGWLKHRCVQWSLVLATTGAILVVLARFGA
ncbi:Pycsar system effector family protein [Streptomyces abikoensis]|uniref:Pycsar system effector family protein n=1 Tax=Streptomyces abikoensis TaxID=97398 RepID=UPI003401174E